METDLRPLTLGEILDKTAQLYRTNFLLFTGIFAVTNGIVLVLILVLEGVSPAYRAIQTTAKFQSGPVMFFLVVLGLAGLLLYGASIAAITRAVAWVYVGEPATIRAAYSSTLPRLGRYLWMMVIATLVLLGIAVVAVIALGIAVFLVVAALGVMFKTSGRTAGIVGFIFGVFIDIALLAILAWFGTRYALGIPACVVENLKARKALRRSVDLSKDSRGRIFMLFLLVGVIQIGLLVLTQTPFYIYTFRHHLHLPVGLSILSQFISLATNTFIGPVLAAGLTLFYFDQRVRKEGYDVEWMMKAAGLEARISDHAVAGVPANEGGTQAEASGQASAPHVLSPGDTA